MRRAEGVHVRALALAVLAMACSTPGVGLSERAVAPVQDEAMQAAELKRAPDAAVHAQLASKDAAQRGRAALAAGRSGDAEALPRLGELLMDADSGELAAWALGRIEGGRAALIQCLQATHCPAAAPAARALGGPQEARAPSAEAVAALAEALKGAPAVAAEAGVALGVLARAKGFKPSPGLNDALGVALQRPEGAVQAGAAYALSRTPKGEMKAGVLEAALASKDVWTRSSVARAIGRQGLPAAALTPALQDPEWRVRVEAARGLGLTPAGAGPVLGTAIQAAAADLAGGAAGSGAAKPAPGSAARSATAAHVLVALFESAVLVGELALPSIPDPSTLSGPTAAATVAARCGAALARDRIRKQLTDTPACGKGLEPEWKTRLRAGALAAELSADRPDLLPRAREALHDPDARVRAQAAGASGAALAPELRELLKDSDAFVVQEAAGALSKDAALAQGSMDAALAAVQRLAAAHDKPTGDPQSDALAGLAELVAAAQPKDPPPALQALLPTPSVVLGPILYKMYKMPEQPKAPSVPPEARSMPAARVLHLQTTGGELVVNLRPGEAPFTSSALAALARKGFYDNLTFHRVVPDFVVQGGDPRGDGDGGPGWSLPDEHTPLRFQRGTLGIATSGPETGGSQFFFCHSPQPHLDGRYTIAGELTPASLDVLDSLQPGDTILSANPE